MHTKEIRRRTGVIAAVVVGMIVGMMVLPGVSSASRPATPMNIVDPENPDEYLAQVTEDGALQVTGQVSVAGTSAVQVTNFPAVQPVDGTVNVGNLPAVQKVNGSVDAATPRAGAYESGISPEFDILWRTTFPVIDARFISLSSDDEITINLHSPDRGGPAIVLGRDRTPTQTISLPLIVPIDSISALCENESEDCTFQYTIIGE